MSFLSLVQSLGFHSAVGLEVIGKMSRFLKVFVAMSAGMAKQDRALKDPLREVIKMSSRWIATCGRHLHGNKIA